MMIKLLYTLPLATALCALASCQPSEPDDASAAATEHTHTAAHASHHTFETTGSIEILAPRGNEIIDPKASIEVLSRGYLWTEGPVWVDTAQGGYVLFSDIPNNNMHKFDPNTGITEEYLKPSGATALVEGDYNGGSNGLLLDAQGRLVLLQQGDRRIATMQAPLNQPEPRFESIVSHYQGKRLNSPNDAVFHTNGDLFFTDPPYGLQQGADDPRRELDFNGVFRVDNKGELHVLDDTLAAPNGIGLSPDGKTLYVAVSDKTTPLFYAYDLIDGALSNRRVLFDTSTFVEQGDPGVPDGMAVAKDGTLYATGPGGVFILSPEGELLARILTGKKTANCTLSADESTLYMTAHDTFMRVALK